MSHGPKPEQRGGGWLARLMTPENAKLLPVLLFAVAGTYGAFDFVVANHEAIGSAAINFKGSLKEYMAVFYDATHGTATSPFYAESHSFITLTRERGFWDPTMGTAAAQATFENGFEQVNPDGSISRFELVRGPNNSVVDIKLVEGGERGTGPWIDKQHHWHDARGLRPNGEVSQDAYEQSTAERIARGDHPYEPSKDKKVGAKIDAEVRAGVTQITGPLKNNDLPNSIVLSTLNTWEHPILGNDGVDATPRIEEAKGFTDQHGRQWELWQKKDGKIYFRPLYEGADRHYPRVDQNGHWDFGK